MNIVISQPMYFPWVGMFEQIRQCDVFVHYNDVQFSKGSFTSRVQIKTDSSEGFNWLTVPLKKHTIESTIQEIEIDYRKNWQNQHLELLKQAYKNAPYKLQMLALVEEVFATQPLSIAELSMKSMETVVDYFTMANGKQFFVSSQLNIAGNSSERVLHIVRHFQGTKYITGHGAKNYLQHELFEEVAIKVHYMNYLRKPYPQLHGAFNPHVSILDLIANVGKEGLQYIISSTKNWRDFINESHRTI